MEGLHVIGFIIIPFMAWLLYELIYLITHTHPLSSDAIDLHSKIRRSKRIKAYYSFNRIER